MQFSYKRKLSSAVHTDRLTHTANLMHWLATRTVSNISTNVKPSQVLFDSKTKSSSLRVTM